MGRSHGQCATKRWKLRTRNICITWCEESICKQKTNISYLSKSILCVPLKTENLLSTLIHYIT